MPGTPSSGPAGLIAYPIVVRYSNAPAIASWYRPDGRLSRGQLAEQQARYALALLEARLPH